MKKYLVSIQHPRGGILSIGYYTDTPGKNYRLYYSGSDTGDRYERIGNAARALEKMAKTWENIGARGIIRKYATIDKIPRRGSNA